MTPEELASRIDHTLLKPQAQAEAIEKICADACQHGFFSVCIAPTWLETAAACLQTSYVKLCAVIGFPLGSTLPQVKAYEAAQSLDAGANELDMVISIGALKDGCSEFVENDIAGVVKVAQSTGAIVKVILETEFLSDHEIEEACRLSMNAGANFVKTSTGFGEGGAEVKHVRLMRECVGPDAGVKASGGIRDLATAQAMLDAGASRLGCSASVAIIEELRRSTEAV